MIGSEADQARRGRWAVVEYANGEMARIVGICREREDADDFAAHLSKTMPRTDGTIVYAYGSRHADNLEVTA